MKQTNKEVADSSARQRQHRRSLSFTMMISATLFYTTTEDVIPTFYTLLSLPLKHTLLSASSYPECERPAFLQHSTPYSTLYLPSSRSLSPSSLHRIQCSNTHHAHYESHKSHPPNPTKLASRAGFSSYNPTVLYILVHAVTPKPARRM